MHICWSKRIFLGATFAAGSLLAVGCGKTASGGSDTDAAVEADAAVDAATPEPDAAPLTPDAAELPPDAAPPPPTDECGADVTLIDLNAEATADGPKLTYHGNTADTDQFAASCTPAESTGSDALLKFTAPSDGFWRFSTEGSVIDTVLYALTDCKDGFSEVACSDDISGGNKQSSILLDLHAGDVRYIVVDRSSGAGSAAFTLTAEAISAHKPTVSEFHAYYSPDTGAAGIRVTGMDEDADVTQFKWGVFGADGSQIALDQAQPELVSAFADFAPFAFVQNPDGSCEAHGAAAPQGGFPVLTAMSFQFGDSNGLWSDPVKVDVAPSDVVDARGAACDGARVLDLCGEADACVDRDADGNFTCDAATAPVVTTATAYYNATTNGFALHFQGDDPENDFSFVRVLAADAANNEVQLGQAAGGVGVGLYRAQQADGHFDALVVFNGSFNATCLPPAQQHYQDCTGQMRPEQTCIDEANGLLDMCNREQAALVTHFTYVPGDAALKVGAQADVAVVASPEAVDGGTCDVLYGSGQCIEGQLCANLPGGDAYDTCTSPDQTACPDGYAAEDITATLANGRWVVHGDTSASTNHGGFGSCGGGGPNLVYKLTVPADGTYHAEIGGLPNGGDSVLFARTACTFYDAQFELGCNDDIDTQGGNYASSIDMAATANQDVYIFVDSYAGTAPSAFTLTVTGP